MRSAIGEMWWEEPGLLWHRIDEGASMGESEAKAVKEMIAEMAAGRPVVMVVDLRGIGYVDAAARDLMAQGAAGLQVATALLVDRGFSLHVAELFMRFSGPDRPVEKFFREDDARDWAESFVKSEGA